MMLLEEKLAGALSIIEEEKELLT